MTLEKVEVPAVPIVWDRFGVGRMIEEHEWRAGGRLSSGHVYEALLRDEYQLWLVLENRERIKAALVTDLTPYPNGYRTCTVLIVVGEETRAWIPLKAVLEDWAKRSGCAAIEAYGRKGWKRVLDDWELTQAVYEKRL